VSEAPLTGWWSVDGDVPREVLDRAGDLLVEAAAAGKQVVAYGDTRFVWHHLPVATEEAIRAAERERIAEGIEAAFAAWERGEYPATSSKDAILAIVRGVK